MVAVASLAAGCVASFARAEDAAHKEAIMLPARSSEVELAQRGKAIYAQHCSHCHGFNMVSAGNVTFDLRQFPRDQKERFLESVVNGKDRRMPPWGDALSLDEIDAIWAYVLTGGK